MFLPRCNPLGLPGPMTMAGTAMGGMAMLAGIGPFLAGIGVVIVVGLNIIFW